MRTCYVLRHVPFESLGLLEQLLIERHLEIRLLDVPVTVLPTALIQRAELVIVLGGPISAYEGHIYPFLSEELRLLEHRFQDKKATLGICLGAQLMAQALGARVYPGTQPEIGWSKLQLTETRSRHLLAAIEQQPVLHWHGDTFDLPNGAELLASTHITPHQAFSWEGIATGLQFHLEVTAPELEAWYVGHACELSRSKPIPELREAGRISAPALAPHALKALGTILDEMLRATNDDPSPAS